MLDLGRPVEIATVIGTVGDRPALEVAAPVDAVPIEDGCDRRGVLTVERVPDLVGRPGGEQALDAVAVLVGRVGVLCREEAAVGVT